MTDIIDSYGESNKDSYASLQKIHPSTTTLRSAIGQSFNASLGDKLTSVKFYLQRLGSPTGVINAVLYAHSGTYGTSSVPTGSALATSDDFDPSTIATDAFYLYTFTFSGVNQYTLISGTKYCIELQVKSGSWSTTNCIRVGIDTTSPTHGGNYSQYASSAWTATSGWDTCFYVYGEAVAPSAGGVLAQVM